jgi:hypothetical protein
MALKHWITISVAFILLGFGCNNQTQLQKNNESIENPQALQSSGIQLPATHEQQEQIYTNTKLHFEIYKPEDASIEMVPVSIGTNERVAQVNIGNNVVISVYETRSGLEQDFSNGGTFEERMKDWKKTVIDINGKPSNVFSKNEYVDGVGAIAESAVMAEVVGPTYAYMIQFYGISDDPHSAILAQYLSSFKAN